VLASEEARIHGTAAGSEHRACGQPYTEMNAIPELIRYRTIVSSGRDRENPGTC
jgi:hypothetical protein